MRIIINDYDTSGRNLEDFDRIALEQILGDELTVPQKVLDMATKAVNDGRCDPELRDSLIADMALSENGIDTSYISATDWSITDE